MAAGEVHVPEGLQVCISRALGGCGHGSDGALCGTCRSFLIQSERKLFALICLT